MQGIQKKYMVLPLLALLAAFIVLGAGYGIGKYRLEQQRGQCNYQAEDRQYISKDPLECVRIQFLCSEGGKRFNDICGCGCEGGGLIPLGGKEQYACPADSRQEGACIALYQPVCGWFNSSQIQCIRYPCAQTYSNSCFACQNQRVSYWTDGECPA